MNDTKIAQSPTQKSLKTNDVFFLFGQFQAISVHMRDVSEGMISTGFKNEGTTI